MTAQQRQAKIRELLHLLWCNLDRLPEGEIRKLVTELQEAKR